MDLGVERQRCYIFVFFQVDGCSVWEGIQTTLYRLIRSAAVPAPRGAVASAAWSAPGSASSTAVKGRMLRLMVRRTSSNITLFVDSLVMGVHFR
jgi:hypothetical protein